MSTSYETDSLLSMYIDFHYGPSYFQVENFPVRCIEHALKHVNPSHTNRALDLGCATGRSSFELAKTFAHVDALDYSERLVGTAKQLQRDAVLHYTVQDEGNLRATREVRLADFDGYAAAKARITFAKADACNLSGLYKDYDLVFGGNLIDRLYDPPRFINLIKQRVNAGGLLVLASPYTWLEEFTPLDKWLGGYTSPSSEHVTTLQGLTMHLAPEFEMIADPVDVPFVIRETRRKFQHTLSQLTVWRKHGQ